MAPKPVRPIVPEERHRQPLPPLRHVVGMLPLWSKEMNVVVHRWSAGKNPMDSRWTELVGSMMEAHETPTDVYIKFNHWLKTGEWGIVCQCCPAR